MKRRERTAMRRAAAACALMGMAWCLAAPAAAATKQLDPLTIAKYAAPMVIPPVMPPTATGAIDYYEIAVRQFQQQILPAPFPPTTVWSYGSVNHAGTFNYPAFTIETIADTPVRVKWINGLMGPTGNYLPHLLPIDQTIHWANPPGPRDTHGMEQATYTGPVPMVVHVHGAHVDYESDGYPEAWFLPAASNIPSDIKFTVGGRYDDYKAEAKARYGVDWEPGTATYQYRNDQRATTLWYHDHSLGITRENVYAGPAGFFLIRGGDSDLPAGVLPFPAPKLGDAPGKVYYEIPIVVQDRTFKDDASLFYPSDRAFFEGVQLGQLQIPFIPDINPLNGLLSDARAIWNPEFFGNVMVANGVSWPTQNVEPRRYRFRWLNGCNSRTLILKFNTPLNFWQIGSEGGFLPAPVELSQLLIGPAERADAIVDFTGIPVGTQILLTNLAPDYPYQGGVPGVDFPPADPATTGQVMKFIVVAPGPGSLPDTSTPPASLALPAITPIGDATVTRQISTNELDSATVRVSTDPFGNIVLDPNGVPFGPTQALLGTVNPDGTGNPLMWDDVLTETPPAGATEMWAINNFTVDGHPIHLHQVAFQVVDRTPRGDPIGGPTTRPPQPWETGFKDTVIALPGEITRVKALFDLPGQYVWHCHILEHEDNEMMRPYFVGDNFLCISLDVSANRVAAGEAFSLGLKLENTVPRSFDLYLLASIQGQISTVTPSGALRPGIQPVLRNMAPVSPPFSTTILNRIAVPPGLTSPVTFYAVAVPPGMMPPVSSPDQLAPTTQNVIALDKVEVNIL